LYFQRPEVKVAIIPASNLTDKVGAPIVLDKAWEESLTKAVFTVTNADSVVTYASASGTPLADLAGIPRHQLGADLGVDFLLFNEIVNWGQSYHVIASQSVVACRSTLVEASTGAAVWKYDWVRIEGSGSSGGGIIGAMVEAAVDAVVDSMTDAVSTLAVNAVAGATTTIPYAGVAPASLSESVEP
jgi:hypothetical protein